MGKGLSQGERLAVKKRALAIFFKANGRGRPKKKGVDRYPGGSIVNEQRGEKPEERTAVVLAQRTKAVGKKHAADPLAGFELGRLKLNGIISERQMRGGIYWAQSIDRYGRLMGFPSPFPQALDYGAVGGRGEAREPAADQVRAASQDVTVTATIVGQHGRAVSAACREVCVLETDTTHWPSHTFEALRKGLDALAEHYGLK
jgi:hypothetical protein